MKCSVCKRKCDDTYGFGKEVHCSARCHDIAMRLHARDKMTPKEINFFDEIRKLSLLLYGIK